MKHAESWEPAAASESFLPAAALTPLAELTLKPLVLKTDGHNSNFSIMFRADANPPSTRTNAPRTETSPHE